MSLEEGSCYFQVLISCDLINQSINQSINLFAT